VTQHRSHSNAAANASGPPCPRCNGDGWIMQTMAQRSAYAIRENNGDYEAAECPTCKGRKALPSPTPTPTLKPEPDLLDEYADRLDALRRKVELLKRE